VSRPKPLVALLGVPNVGKSTIANKLSKNRKSITSSEPGITRDAVLHKVRGEKFWILDTAGFQESAKTELDKKVLSLTEKLKDECELFLLVLDGRRNISSYEKKLIKSLEVSKLKYIIVVNKIDDEKVKVDSWNNIGSLQIDPVFISSQTNYGFKDLIKGIKKLLPKIEFEDTEGLRSVGIFGRPGVGKSTLFNRIMKQELSVTSHENNTTRDIVEGLWDECNSVLVDTGGMNKKKPKSNVEAYSRRRTISAINNIDVGLVVVDPEEGITRQDCRLIGELIEAGAALMILAGKSDLGIEVKEVPSFCKFVNIHHVSGLTGDGIDELGNMIGDLMTRKSIQMQTATINKIFQDVTISWPQTGNRACKHFYSVQVGTSPPKIRSFVSDVDKVDSNHIRSLETGLRRFFPLSGVPVKFDVSNRPKKDFSIRKENLNKKEKIKGV